MFSLAAQCGLAGQCFQHEKDYDFRPKITKFGPYWHFRSIIGPPGPFGAIPDQNGGVFFQKEVPQLIPLTVKITILAQKRPFCM